MSKRDFFRVIIKLFCLYSLVVSAFQFFPSVLQYSRLAPGLWSGVFIFGTASLIVLLYVFVVRKTDLIVDWLKLDRGFDDEKIEIGNFDSIKMLSFASILIGGFLIVDYLPSFLYQAFEAFRNLVEPGDTVLFNYMDSDARYFDFGIAIMNLLLGYLLITNHRNMAQWLTRINSKNSHSQND